MSMLLWVDYIANNFEMCFTIFSDIMIRRCFELYFPIFFEKKMCKCQGDSNVQHFETVKHFQMMILTLLSTSAYIWWKS